MVCYGLPQHIIRLPSQFIGTHLYSWVERSTLRHCERNSVSFFFYYENITYMRIFPVDNVHEKITRSCLAENECILM